VLPQPVFPSKRQLALLVMVVSILIGLAAAYVQTVVHPSFATERELREFTKRPVLGSLTMIEDPKMLDVMRQDRLKLAGVFGLFLVVHAAWVALIALRSGT